MARRELPPSRPLRRASGGRPLPPAVAIFCEGKTEERLLQDLRAYWRVARATVRIVGEQGVPKSVVNAATEHRDAHKKDRPSIVVVFDRDEHPCWQEAIQTAAARGFVVAASNPCFELWGLLLHEDRTAELHRYVAHSDLKKLHPKYDHENHPYLDVGVVIERLPDAARRAEHLARRAEVAGDPYGCPTTRFSAAVDLLRPPTPPPPSPERTSRAASTARAAR